MLPIFTSDAFIVFMMFYGQLIILYSKKSSRVKHLGDPPSLYYSINSEARWTHQLLSHQKNTSSSHTHLLIGIVNAVEITCTASTWSQMSVPNWLSFSKRVAQYHTTAFHHSHGLNTFRTYTSACIFHYTSWMTTLNGALLDMFLVFKKTYFTVEWTIIFLQFVPDMANPNPEL